MVYIYIYGCLNVLLEGRGGEGLCLPNTDLAIGAYIYPHGFGVLLPEGRNPVFTLRRSPLLYPRWYMHGGGGVQRRRGVSLVADGPGGRGVSSEQVSRVSIDNIYRADASGCGCGLVGIVFLLGSGCRVYWAINRHGEDPRLL